MKHPKQNKDGGKSTKRVFALNRRARFDYHIEETVECGLVLDGWEVKSIRSGKADLSGAYVLFRSGEAFLIGMKVTPLDSIDLNAVEPKPERTRKLLLKKMQLLKFMRAVRVGNLTCVPLDLHPAKSGYLKLTIALGRGKKKADKRERIKERDWERNKAKAIKRHSEQAH